MNISYSELIVLNQPVLQNVDRLAQIGATRIELMMDGASWDSYNEDFSELILKLRARDLHYSVHPAAWDCNITAETKILRDAAYQHNLQVLRFAAEIGANQVVLHPGFVGSPGFCKKQAQQRAWELTSRLAVKAKALGLTLGFENVGYHGQSLYSEEEYARALDQIDPVVEFLIDVGHAHLNGWDIPRLITRVAPRLGALHLHDNDGQSDQHLPFFQGTIDWEGVFKAMRSCRQDCNYILEYAPGISFQELKSGDQILRDRFSL